MSLAFYKEQRYDLQGQEEINFLRSQGHEDSYITQTLIPLRKKGRRRWQNRISAKKSYERHREIKRDVFRMRSAAQRAKMAEEDPSYHRRKKLAQQREWREKNREKLAEKARLRRMKIKRLFLKPLQIVESRHCDSDHESPLPPSDPPSPASSEDIFTITPPPHPPLPPKVPTDWHRFGTANQYKPARVLFRQWISPNTVKVSTVQQGPRIGSSKTRRDPVLYSFQKKEYREQDNAEAVRFMTVAKRVPLCDRPEEEVHGAASSSSPHVDRSPDPPQHIPMSPRETDRTTQAQATSETVQPAPLHKPVTASISRANDMHSTAKRDGARVISRRYYQRNRAKVLAKAARYRKEKRAQLQSCGDGEQLDEARSERTNLLSKRTKTENRIAKLQYEIAAASSSTSSTTTNQRLLRELREKIESLDEIEQALARQKEKVKQLELAAGSAAQASLPKDSESKSRIDDSHPETPGSKRERPADAETETSSVKRARTVSTEETPSSGVQLIADSQDGVQYEKTSSLRLPFIQETPHYHFPDVEMVGNIWSSSNAPVDFHSGVLGVNQPPTKDFDNGYANHHTPPTLSDASLASFTNPVPDHTMAPSAPDGYVVNCYQSTEYEFPGRPVEQDRNVPDNYISPHNDDSTTRSSSDMGLGGTLRSEDDVNASSNPAAPALYAGAGVNGLGMLYNPGCNSASSSHFYLSDGSLEPSSFDSLTLPSRNSYHPSPTHQHHTNSFIDPTSNHTRILTTQMAYQPQKLVAGAQEMNLISSSHDLNLEEQTNPQEPSSDESQGRVLVEKYGRNKAKTATILVLPKPLTLDETISKMKVFNDTRDFPTINDPSDCWSLARDLGHSDKGVPLGLPTNIHGVPLRTLMEQHLLSPDVKANPDGSLPMDPEIARAEEIWEETVELEQKKDEKFYIQRADESDFEYNSRMHETFCDGSENHLKSGGLPGRYTLPFKAREWLRTDARHGRLAGFQSIEFALTALTTSCGLLKCIYHHNSMKNLGKHDLSSREEYQRVYEEREAILAFILAKKTAEKEGRAGLKGNVEQSGAGPSGDVTSAVDGVMVEKEGPAENAVTKGVIGTSKKTSAKNAKNGKKAGKGEEEAEEEIKVPALPKSLLTGTPEQGIRPRADKKEAAAKAQATESGTKGKGKSSDDVPQRKRGYAHCGCRLIDLLAGFYLWKVQSIYSPTLDIRETYANNHLQPYSRNFLLDAVERISGARVIDSFAYTLVEDATGRYYVENRPEWILTKTINRCQAARDEIVSARAEKLAMVKSAEEVADNRPIN
ncbi:hypothetical protein VNI00_006105 [Paramarasmius palmivorus]|uniref:BZIP domain-containing protein n=1 Tax=Paramarasmius palmivorus TaxID=297713 RepID=A0AAW0D8F2_9AGAR